MFEAVLSKTSANVGTFSINDGNVMKGSTALITWFNDKSVLIPMTARSSFTLPDEHSMFDQILIALTQANISIQYVDSLFKFMDPQARFKEFLDGTLAPASVGLELTSSELTVPTAYASAYKKFEKLFTLPTPALSAGVDLVALGCFTTEQISGIEAWRNGSSDVMLGRAIRSHINENPGDRNVLRLVKTGGNSHVVENAEGHRITKTRFMTAWKDRIKPIWDHTAPNGQVGQISSFRAEASEHRGYRSARTVTVYNNYVTIGCQSIPRAEIEAMVGKIEALTK